MQVEKMLVKVIVEVIFRDLKSGYSSVNMISLHSADSSIPYYLTSGPLTYDDDGKQTLVGVVSWGRECGLKDYPGVYARITEVLPWIQEELSKTC